MNTQLNTSGNYFSYLGAHTMITDTKRATAPHGYKLEDAGVIFDSGVVISYREDETPFNRWHTGLIQRDEFVILEAPCVYPAKTSTVMMASFCGEWLGAVLGRLMDTSPGTRLGQSAEASSLDETCATLSQTLMADVSEELEKLMALTEQMEKHVRLTRSEELVNLAKQAVSKSTDSVHESVDDWAHRLAADVKGAAD
jgi:hypothetical protein